MKAPMPQGRPGRIGFLRMLRLLRKDILTAQSDRLYRARLAWFRLPGRTSVVINDVTAIRSILSGRLAASRRASWVRRGLAPIMGEGLFLTEGAAWREDKNHLKSLEKTFTLGASLSAFAAARDRARARLSGATSEPLDLEDYATDVMLEIAFIQLFSVGPTVGERRCVQEAFQAYQRTSPFIRISSLVPMPSALRRFSARQLAASRLRGVLQKRLDTRQHHADGATRPQSDGLAALIASAEKNRKTQRWIIDQLAVYLLAGHETGAAALSWALYLLAENQDAQTRVAREGAVLLTRRRLEPAQVAGLSFSRDAFRETLRLFPPLPMLVREMEGMTNIGGKALRKGDQAVVSLWHLHRHGDLWAEPHAFRPDRWQGAERKTIQPGSFLPFSHGPRSCPAASLALAEGGYLLAMTCALATLKPVANDRPVPAARMTTRSRSGIRVWAAPREKTRAPQPGGGKDFSMNA